MRLFSNLHTIWVKVWFDPAFRNYVWARFRPENRKIAHSPAAISGNPAGKEKRKEERCQEKRKGVRFIYIRSLSTEKNKPDIFFFVQANTERRKPVLSVVFVGARLIAKQLQIRRSTL